MHTTQASDKKTLRTVRESKKNVEEWAASIMGQTTNERHKEKGEEWNVPGRVKGKRSMTKEQAAIPI